MAEPYTVAEVYPDARVIVARGERSMVQSLTPISDDQWTVRMQEEADRMATVIGGAA